MLNMSDLFSKMGFNYWQVAFSSKILDLLEDKRNTFIFNEILWSKFLQQRTLITIIAESSQVSSRSRWLVNPDLWSVDLKQWEILYDMLESTAFFLLQ